MTEEQGGFERARARLEQIATEVRDKETPLEQCLDLLEEGVSVANRCTELLDHTEWRSVVEAEESDAAAEAGEDAADAGEADDYVPEPTEAAGDEARAEDAPQDASEDDAATRVASGEEPDLAPEDDEGDGRQKAPRGDGEAPQESSDASEEADTDG